MTWKRRASRQSRSAAADAGVAEATRITDASTVQANKDLAYQTAKAHEERKTVTLPLRRAIEVNHLAATVLEHLIGDSR